ncbi:hypothetical protein CVT24_006424 [Panaeolus cyanescens]|uniref:Anaphase-promoting complex subunit 4 WD40 domain-containing protein n=1 Tax=Panaeolus cyanescens TaxID=181874 RepID=A0A409WI35_9AGAR|nr:hypothetical protein CVT24_006424 [Panaeolus cyanescens]
MSLTQFMDRYISAPRSRYRLTKVLYGSKGPINCVTFLDHRLLLSGSDDHVVNVYDLNRMALIQRLSDRDGMWGQITCIARVNTADGPQGFVVGTGRGRLISFRRQVKDGDQFAEMDCQKLFSEPGDYVESLAFDPHTNFIACSSKYGHLTLCLVGPNGTLTKKWTIERAGGQDQIIRAMHFIVQGTKLITYSMQNSRVCTRDTATGAEINDDRRCLQNFVYVPLLFSVMDREWVTDVRFIFWLSSANLDYNPESQCIVVDNLTSGFDLYAWNKPSPKKKFDTKRANPAFTVDVKFAESGSLIVGGSDHGIVYIFDTGTGELLQRLYQDTPSTPIQSLATWTTPDGDHIIVSGSSSSSTPTLHVWQKPRTTVATVSQATTQHPRSFAHVVSPLYHTAVLILALSSLGRMLFPAGTDGVFLWASRLVRNILDILDFWTPNAPSTITTNALPTVITSTVASTFTSTISSIVTTTVIESIITSTVALTVTSTVLPTPTSNIF